MDTIRVSVPAAMRFTAESFRAVGVNPADSQTAARILVLSDQRGIRSHGIARLPAYIRAIQDGSIRSRAKVRIVAARPGTELWDAGHGLGQPIAAQAMTRAIALAGDAGVGLVVVRNSSHFGIAGAYVEQAMAARMIGIALTNADPHVLPTGARRPGLGTNPIAVGGRGAAGQDFLLDMATSVVPGGRLEVAARDGRAIPLGWAVDTDGRDTADPVAGLGGALLPLGGYKGYGLGAAVDLLTGVLGGSGSGPDVRSLFGQGRSNVGHLLLAIDPAAFGPVGGYERRLTRWTRSMRGLADDPGSVLIPGEPESRAARLNSRSIPIDSQVLRDLADLGESLGVGLGLRALASRGGRTS